jgi:hypothetical protein
MFAEVAFLAVMLDQRRLLIEQIEMARRSGHEQLHNSLYFRLVNARRMRRAIGSSLIGHHRSQRNPAQAAARSGQPIATGKQASGLPGRFPQRVAMKRRAHSIVIHGSRSLNRSRQIR